MNCEFCNKPASDKYNLIRHQQTAKKCIKIQQEKNNPNIRIKTFDCKFCKKKLSSQNGLKYHLNVCKSKPITYINNAIIIEDIPIENDLNLEISAVDDNPELIMNIDIDTVDNLETSKELFKQLQNELRKVKDDLKNKNAGIVNNYIVNNNNTTTINNNITINMNFLDFMTGENIKKIFDKEYNGKTFLGAEKSLAEFLVEKFLLGKDKPSYFCPDKSRYNFTYFDNDELMEDLNAKILITLSKIYGADAIYNAYIDNRKNIENIENIDAIYDKLKNIDHNNKEILNELRILLPKNLKDREIQNKIYEIKLEDEEKTRLIQEEEDKKKKIEKQLLENINLDDYENIKGLKKVLLEEFIKLYLRTGELKCPKNFSDKDIVTFKRYIYKWSKLNTVSV
jgi:hypothetical protein